MQLNQKVVDWFGQRWPMIVGGLAVAILACAAGIGIATC
jgi:hypothetical protein